MQSCTKCGKIGAEVTCVGWIYTFRDKITRVQYLCKQCKEEHDKELMNIYKEK